MFFARGILRAYWAATPPIHFESADGATSQSCSPPADAMFKLASLLKTNETPAAVRDEMIKLVQRDPARLQSGPLAGDLITLGAAVFKSLEQRQSTIAATSGSDDAAAAALTSSETDRSILSEGIVAVAQQCQTGTMDLLSLIQCAEAVYMLGLPARRTLNPFLAAAHVITTQRGLSRSMSDIETRVACASVILSIVPLELTGTGHRLAFLDPSVVITGYFTSDRHADAMRPRFSAKVFYGLAHLLQRKALKPEIATALTDALLSDTRMMRQMLLDERPQLLSLQFILRSLKGLQKNCGTSGLDTFVKEIIDVYGIVPSVCHISKFLPKRSEVHRQLVELAKQVDVSTLPASDCSALLNPLQSSDEDFCSCYQRIYARCAEESSQCSPGLVRSLLVKMERACQQRGHLDIARACGTSLSKLLDRISQQLSHTSTAVLFSLLELRFVKVLFPEWFANTMQSALDLKVFANAQTFRLRDFLCSTNVSDAPQLAISILHQHLHHSSRHIVAHAILAKHIVAACNQQPPSLLRDDFVTIANLLLSHRGETMHPLVGASVVNANAGERLVLAAELCDVCDMLPEQIRMSPSINQLFVGLFSNIRTVISEEMGEEKVDIVRAPQIEASDEDGHESEEPAGSTGGSHRHFAHTSSLNDLDAAVTWFLKKGLRLPAEASPALSTALSLPSQQEERKQRHSLLIAALHMPSVPTPPELDIRDSLKLVMRSCPSDLLPTAFKAVCEPSFAPPDVSAALAATLENEASGQAAHAQAVETVLRLLFLHWVHDRSGHSSGAREFTPELLSLVCSALRLTSLPALLSYSAAYMHLLPNQLQLFLWQAIKDRGADFDALDISILLTIACCVDESATVLMPKVLPKVDQISPEVVLKVTLHCPSSHAVCQLICNPVVMSKLPAIFCARILCAVGLGAPQAALEQLSNQLFANDAIDTLGDDDWSFLVISLDRHLASTEKLEAQTEELHAVRGEFEKLFVQALRLGTVNDPMSLQNFVSYFPPAAVKRALGPFCDELRSRILPIVAEQDARKFIPTLHVMKQSCFNGPELMGVVLDHYFSALNASCMTIDQFDSALMLIKTIAAGVIDPQQLPPLGLELFSMWTTQVTSGDPLTRPARLLDALSILVDSKMSGPWCETLVNDLLLSVDDLSPNDFSRLVQQVSRTKGFSERTRTALRSAFRRFHSQSDAHSRATLFKALAIDEELFREFEVELIAGAQENVDFLGPDDIESIMVPLMGCARSESVELLMDSLCTRLLHCFAQVRRSTLVRVLQCMAHFKFSDSDLTSRIMAALEESREIIAKLDAIQILTLLKAVVELRIPLSEQVAVGCFFRLEQLADVMTTSQIVAALELAQTIEMAFISPIAQLLNRVYENRDFVRGNEALSKVLEDFCEEFSADIPQTASVVFLRKKWSKQRQATLYARQLQGSSLN